MLIAHLNDDTGILGEERLHDVVAVEVVQVDVETTLRVAESHLEQGGDESAGRDVVASHHPSAANQLLHGIEAIDKVFGILHCRHVVANLAKALCEGRTTQPLLIEREVDVVNR